MVFSFIYFTRAVNNLESDKWRLVAVSFWPTEVDHRREVRPRTTTAINLLTYVCQRGGGCQQLGGFRGYVAYGRFADALVIGIDVNYRAVFLLQPGQIDVISFGSTAFGVAPISERSQLALITNRLAGGTS